MAQSFDAIVVGAGVIGAAVGFELAKAGFKTLNIDKLPAAGYGSTGSSSAVVRTFYSTHDGAKLALEGLHAWRAWRDHVGDVDERGLARFVEIGCCVVKTAAEEPGLRRIRQVMDDLEIPYEDWDGARLKEHLPFADLARYGPPKPLDDPHFGEPAGGDIPGALYFPESGYVTDPQLAAHNLQVAAEAAGAIFRFNAEIAAIRKAGGRVAGVTLKNGEDIDAPVVVNVGGPYSRHLNRMAGVSDTMSVSTRPMRQEVAYVPMPEAFGTAGERLLMTDGDVGSYCRADSGGKILVGTLEPACDDLLWHDGDPADLDRSHSEQWTKQVYRMAQRLPDLPIPNTAQGVVDLYDVSDDWIPIYDKSDLPGFYMAVGTSGNQFKCAPVAGELMAALIGYCEGGHDHDSEPLRFGLRRTGNTLDLGFFSRRRQAVGESSGTVIG